MHENRCNRRSESSITRFGDSAYSREELVAEIGSAMICNRLGIDHVHVARLVPGAVQARV
jgi:antirestriction protein ArdC